MAKKASPKGKAGAKSTSAKSSKRKAPAGVCPKEEGVVETGVDGESYTSTLYDSGNYRWKKTA